MLTKDLCNLQIMFEKVMICTYPSVDDRDLRLLEKTTCESSSVDCFHRNLSELECCGFYYCNLTMIELENIFKEKEPGRFLLRDSRSRSFYYVLSFLSETKKLVNIRIFFHDGKFIFDGGSLRSTSVIGLIKLFRKRLSRPIFKYIPSLLHFSRLVVNKNLNNLSELPVYIQNILKLYPHEL